MKELCQSQACLANLALESASFMFNSFKLMVSIEKENMMKIIFLKKAVWLANKVVSAISPSKGKAFQEKAFEMTRLTLYVAFVVGVLLLMLTDGVHSAKSKTKGSNEAFTQYLNQHKRQSSSSSNSPSTRNPGAVFFLPTSNNNFQDLSYKNLAFSGNSISENPALSSAVQQMLAGGVWVQDFNFTYSNKLNVVGNHAAAALVSLLVASGTKHCTTGLCLRDVTEAWYRSAIERG